MPHHVEFIGIHNSLKLTLGIMKDILEYANTELSYEEQDTYEADIEAVSTQIEELQDRPQSSFRQLSRN